MNKNNKLICLFIFSIFSCSYSIETYKEGKQLYLSQCAACHGNQFEGLGSLYPSLNDTEYINSNRDHLSCWIHKGIGAPEGEFKLRHSDLIMLPLPKLDAAEITNILNYLNAHLWKMNEFTIQEIENQLKYCKENKSNGQ